uniref:cytochrome b n=1 Tax=Haltichella nipponensis TaxID=2907788 RepID=UPI001EDEC5A5|nr:cytochrome b [Haltichella nipponensis]UIB40565.1 cytochrome b [Haltichella nipponensis]
MKKSLFKKNSLLNIINNSLINLPTPLNMSLWWNFGSLLGTCLIIQIITGLILSMHYCPNSLLAFDSIIHIMKDVNYGWLFRLIHMNGASLFFICMFIHIGRNLYYYNFLNLMTWMSGIMIFLMTMMTAFMGYVLPWGQMSLWGATVITNLISAIPYIGEMMVLWIWGGFSVDNPTLNRFFSLHFILPFIVLFLVIVHLMFLHDKGSSNPLGLNSNFFKIPMYPYFIIKDILGMIIMLILLIMLCLLNPYIFMDPENFNIANPMITPIHIQPEWYFLFAYAILRTIPNKLGGVVALIMAIIILVIMPLTNFYLMKSNKFYYFNQILFWWFVSIFFVLTWVGAKPIVNPYMNIAKIYSLLYFSYFIFFYFINKIFDKIIFKYKLIF